jgi:hypothetical protein
MSGKRIVGKRKEMCNSLEVGNNLMCSRNLKKTNGSMLVEGRIDVEERSQG